MPAKYRATSSDFDDDDGSFSAFLDGMAATPEAQQCGAVLFDVEPSAPLYRPCWPPGHGKLVTVLRWTATPVAQFVQLLHLVLHATELVIPWTEYVEGDPATADLSDHEIAELEREGWNSLAGGCTFDYAQEQEMAKVKHKAPVGEVLRHLRKLTGVKVPGITDLFAYFGKKFSFFPMHVEDMLLRSVNVLHGGSPKIWIVVHPRHYRAVERMLRQMAPLYDRCGDWFRHKSFIALPELLTSNGIPWTRIVQRPGQGIMTLEGAVHFGMNLGPNVATAWNCATRSWLRWGRVSSFCACSPLSVAIHVEDIARSFLKAEVARKGADRTLTAVWQRYMNGEGCSLFEPEPFPPRMPVLHSKPLPLRYLKVSGYLYTYAKFEYGEHLYRCRSRTSRACSAAVYLKPDDAFGHYEHGAQEHSHPSDGADLTVEEELELISDVCTKTKVSVVPSMTFSERKRLEN